MTGDPSQTSAPRPLLHVVHRQETAAGAALVRRTYHQLLGFDCDFIEHPDGEGRCPDAVIVHGRIDAEALLADPLLRNEGADGPALFLHAVTLPMIGPSLARLLQRATPGPILVRDRQSAANLAAHSPGLEVCVTADPVLGSRLPLATVQPRRRTLAICVSKRLTGRRREIEGQARAAGCEVVALDPDLDPATGISAPEALDRLLAEIAGAAMLATDDMSLAYAATLYGRPAWSLSNEQETRDLCRTLRRPDLLASHSDDPFPALGVDVHPLLRHRLLRSARQGIFLLRESIRALAAPPETEAASAETENGRIVATG